ncbi:MAG TPA: 3-phosphoshikimate 1-carboxyvinyltransferase [Planctomycetota bacterium]|nr:3-phosphoshikimate 1-carboxyvinyltransferase [Planctomycetota bacterium]HRR80369.1 3-phosphoshikimate 1-carboxyvinyltransferase [Planctomycetota bacterium]HRT94165.1 3-phosphoshikimate 1-carboxyvinyltransferase [Planctomycetota bacterium]
MRLVVERSALGGSVRIPGSKSHTIRAVVIASLAEGTSTIRQPLESLDTLACVRVCRGLGAELRAEARTTNWEVTGTGGKLAPPDNVLDVGNSGTTLYVTLGTAALGRGWSVFTGDDQTRRRPAGALLDALRALGAEAFSTRGDGRAPIVVRGPLRGGRASIECPTSQYLTSLLINCPLAEGDSTIDVPLLHEQPYVEMTLAWLDGQGIRYERDGFRQFRLPGGQRYQAFDRAVPADFSSATFFLCAAAITGSEVTLLGLDRADTQGDKAVVDHLAAMGARVEWLPDGLRLRGGDLRGGEFDLNATPDALPAMAVAACFASGETRLVNVPQARIKETDRLAVMAQELSKMGARVTELPDGLVIQGKGLRGAVVDGHDDHRVVMALAVAGLAASGRTEVTTAEAAAVTFPNFVDLMASLGARMRPSET